jgi:hypothetical protein
VAATYAITEEMIAEAWEYTRQSALHTSDRHDFHEGGIVNKARKMFEGKLGEKVFRQWMRENRVAYVEDRTPYTDPDLYDFRVGSGRIDVKTYTQTFHKYLLEMVEMFREKPKDFYVAVRLRFGSFDITLTPGGLELDTFNVRARSATIVGFATAADVAAARVDNQGYLDNYTFPLARLRPLSELPGALRGPCMV